MKFLEEVPQRKACPPPLDLEGSLMWWCVRSKVETRCVFPVSMSSTTTPARQVMKKVAYVRFSSYRPRTLTALPHAAAPSRLHEVCDALARHGFQRPGVRTDGLAYHREMPSAPPSSRQRRRECWLQRGGGGRFHRKRQPPGEHAPAQPEGEREDARAL